MTSHLPTHHTAAAAAGTPPDLAGIPIAATLPPAVTARALELLRLYRTLAAGSTCDRESIAKACVRQACSEHVLPIDLAKDLWVKSKKQTLAFNHALSSLRQRVPSSAASGAPATRSSHRSVASADVPSLAMILIKLGAITVDVSFAHQLADKMVGAMRREGEITGNTPSYWVERLKLEFQCAAVYLQMKEQKTKVSVAKFAKALEMPATKFDAVVARLQREVKDDLDARFRPRTPPRRKRARELLGGASTPEGGEPEDELVQPSTQSQPPLLSATRPLSNKAAPPPRKRSRTVPSPATADAPECELTAAGRRLTWASAGSAAPDAPPRAAHPPSGFPAAARTLPPTPAPRVEKEPPAARVRLGVGFYSMVPLAHPCTSQRFSEYLEWSEGMENKLAEAIKQLQEKRISRDDEEDVI